MRLNSCGLWIAIANALDGSFLPKWVLVEVCKKGDVRRDGASCNAIESANQLNGPAQLLSLHKSAYEYSFCAMCMQLHFWPHI